MIITKDLIACFPTMRLHREKKHQHLPSASTNVHSGPNFPRVLCSHGGQAHQGCLQELVSGQRLFEPFVILKEIW